MYTESISYDIFCSPVWTIHMYQNQLISCGIVWCVVYRAMLITMVICSHTWRSQKLNLSEWTWNQSTEYLNTLTTRTQSSSYNLISTLLSSGFQSQRMSSEGISPVSLLTFTSKTHNLPQLLFSFSLFSSRKEINFFYLVFW